MREKRSLPWPAILAAIFWRPFPSRQLVLREGDRLRSFTLSPRLQLLAAAAGLGVAIWAVMATFALINDNLHLRAALFEAERHRLAYHELMDEVSGQHHKVRTATGDLEHYRSYLVALLDQLQSHQEALFKAMNRDFPGKGEDERSRLSGADLALRGQLDEMARNLTGLNERSDMLQLDLAAMRSQLADSDDQRLRFAIARAAQERRIDRLEKDLTAVRARNAELDRTIAARQLAIDQLHVARHQAFKERDAANERVALTMRRLEIREGEHREALAQLNQRTQSSILLVENIIASTGLNLAKMPVSPLSVGPRQPRGGPFVPWRGEIERPASPDRDAVAPLNRNLLRLEQLRLLLKALPVSTPLVDLQVMSPFGYRRDPFNGRPAMHEGIDLSAPAGTPVFAAASGRVTFAGWKNAYGQLVEIEHGFGLRTRYAHLSRIDIKEDNMVSQDQVIGSVGTTGRSTGAHLHYEILLEGKPHNPATFLKVKGYVLKE